jgi:dolichyl-phosphate-mannose--protein O-mannosyl transferase
MTESWWLWSVACCVLFLGGLLRYVAAGGPPEPCGELPTAPPAGAKFAGRHWALLACLLAAALATRLWNLGVPGKLYFDEVYFGFTAQSYLAGDADAYNPRASTPPGNGVCFGLPPEPTLPADASSEERADARPWHYEWTHPPLGKLLIASSMAVTSRDVTGMRLGSVVFGTAAVALVVLVTFLLSRSPPAALLAGLLYAVEGLNFAQSRIATMDIHATCFILAAVAFYAAWRRDPASSNWLLLGAGVMAGATVATKWVGFFLIFLLGADLLALWIIRRRRCDPRTVATAGACLVAVPAALYLASYIHYFLQGHGWGDFLELQRQMWRYHSGLHATHAYASKPWQWLLNLRPVWMYAGYPSEGRIANIYNLGNSVVLYFGLLAMVLAAVHFLRRRAWEAGFLLAAYLVFWLPWTASPRIMFFYHYLPSTAFLCAASGWVLSGWRAVRPRFLRALAWIVPILAVAWFALFYPDMTAVSVPCWWADAVYAFVPSWR